MRRKLTLAKRKKRDMIKEKERATEVAALLGGNIISEDALEQHAINSIEDEDDREFAQEVAYTEDRVMMDLLNDDECFAEEEYLGSDDEDI
jgi:hypothetical protein